MITSDQAEGAVDWLRNNARPMAVARAERLYLEQYIKTVKATLMVNNDAESVSAKEMHALAHGEYKQTLLAYQKAIEVDEHYRFLLVAAEAKIEAYRTQEATRRAEGKAFP